MLGKIARVSLRTWLVTGAVILILFAAYLAAGFYLAPGLLRSQATQWVKTNISKDLSLGEIRVDPLKFTVDIRDLAVRDADGPIVGLGHLRVGFSILSVFAPAYRFTEVRMDRPFVRAVVRPDRSLNLIDLVPKTRSEGPSPAVRIDLFAVSDGRIAFADHRRPGRPEETLTPITFTLNDFHTKSDEGGGFNLDARSDTGGSFVWNGRLSIAPIASRGRFVVGGLKSETIQKFAGQYMPVTLTGGQIGFTADYDFAYDANGLRLHAGLPAVTVDALALDGKKEMFNGSVALTRLDAKIGPIAFFLAAKGGPKLTATVPQVGLRGLAVRPPGTPADQALRLEAVALKDVRLDQAARTIALGSLTLDGADMFASRARDGKINLMAMLPQKPAAPPPAAADRSAWKIRLETLAINAAKVRFEDHMVTPVAHFTIAPLTATVSGAGSDLTRPVKVTFDTGFNAGGHANGEVSVTPASVAGDLTFRLTRLPLRSFTSYMPPLRGLELRSGEANASGALHFEGADIGKVTFRGDGAISRFNMLELTTKSPFFAWRDFSLRGIALRRNRLEIARARLDQPIGRVAVLADRSFNFTPLLPPAAATAATAIPLKAGPPAKTASAKPAADAVRFRMRRLDISGGMMGFADYSIEPNFEARIDALKGSIVNITNQPGQAADIDLTGHVIDQYSPVTIKGRMDPLAYARMTDMKLVFRNIELPVFNPYSGRYAGYDIAKGKLTTEFTYKIDNRALKADHHIIIDQLEWGQGTNSKDAVPLPIRLAAALLKDVNGVIDLDVPVTGSLDDPKFRIGPIIWQIIGNLIEKAVTAPFRLIGSLFAGADKAQFIDFAPGSAALPPDAAESLGALAKALNQRPALKLDIPAGPGIAQDATGIADAAIDTQMTAGKGRGGANLDLAAMDADDVHDGLEDLYRAKLGKRPEYPDFTPEQLKAAPGVKADADDDDRTTALEARWLREQLRPAFAPTPPQLAALGEARASAVRNALLADATVDPARVFTQTSATASAFEGHSRLELKFE